MRRSASTSLVGPITFLGLLAANLAYQLTGSRHVARITRFAPEGGPRWDSDRNDDTPQARRDLRMAFAVHELGGDRIAAYFRWPHPQTAIRQENRGCERLASMLPVYGSSPAE